MCLFSEELLDLYDSCESILNKTIDYLDLRIDEFEKYDFITITPTIIACPIDINFKSSLFVLIINNKTKIVVKRLNVPLIQEELLENDFYKIIGSHPNILRLYYSKQTENYLVLKRNRITKYRHLWMIFEYLNVELYKKMPRVRNYKSVLLNILHGLKKIHNSGIIHGDIKLGNVMGNFMSDTSIIYKLIDFDSSRICRGNNHIKINEPIGTCGYIAPEVIHLEVLSKKSDIWSFGCLAYYLVIKFDPFEDTSSGAFNYELYDKFSQPAYVNYNIPFKSKRRLLVKFKDKLLEDFISQCLQPNPKFRPTVDQLINHPFFLDKNSENVKS